jgi:hypothetical protein
MVHQLTAAGSRFVDYVPENRILPTAPDSTAWYRGRRDNVAPARILRAAAPGEVAP